ncbi:MAG: alanine--tRNA ligase [Candidatus Aenigmarchaeota archaeon]|nr:alanine--tRNA ligase [Candidatus Aenigmarchaeota archaeon]MDI6722467.1 alanine--tRNA ligase [Candidatus Aenigmarchaeota archaeon]
MKDALKKKFSDEYKKYYQIDLFTDMGFERKKCRCGNHFWTLDPNRTNCPSQPCQDYEFIGKSPMKRMDYVETWKTIEKFFVDNGHKSVPSYPVVCRWFPGLYFTIASIVAFQRSFGGKTVFELPYNPLIIPQSCLRFNDIPNVGVTGRHGTNFVMIGQHSIYNGKDGYWKDRCIELDFSLLTKALKIRPEEVTFVEDVWLGPNAFGYSLEYFVRGLELGNAVFTEFLGVPENYTQMKEKIIDMGAGLERFVWLSQGTPTSYDAIFGPVMEKLLSLIDHDKDFYFKYSKISGKLNLDEAGDIRKAKRDIAKQLNVSTEELIQKTSPVEALYAIADHSKTLLYAIADGALPSNVGGGYNLRIILRRALGFIDEYNLGVDIADVCELHANYLKKMNPRLIGAVDEIRDILNIEKERFFFTEKKNAVYIENALNKKKFNEDMLIQLYESHGITPEFIEKISKQKNIHVSIPPSFYERISSKHMKAPVKEEKINVNLEGIPPTEFLFYKDVAKFAAKVLRVIDRKYVVLDKTAFFGRSGGQEPDHGFINKCRVYDTEKIGNIIVHLVENPDFEAGDTVEGEIDEERRLQIMRNHTSIHIINGAARKVLGNHVWQAGANKNVDKAHLDITHFMSLSEEDVENIENLANEIVKKSVPVKKTMVPRIEAEQKYGMRIYQGGVVPEKNLNIIEVNGFDVEACGGTHVDNTGEIEKIVVLSTERIQDGIVRINITSWKSADKYLQGQKEILSEVEDILGVKGDAAVKEAERIFSIWKKSRKDRVMDAGEIKYSIVDNRLVEIIEFADMKKLQGISKSLSNDDTFIFLFGFSDKIYVFCSAGKNTGLDAGEIVKDVCERIGGSGGGSRSIAQGFGVKKDMVEDVKDHVRRISWKKEKS